MAASTSRLAPLTRSDSTSISASPYEPQYSTYSSRMAGLSRSSSISSNSSAFSRRGSMSAAASASQEPVIRNGFIIPKITLTPPDEKPQRSEPLPWQDYTSKSALYVPVKTEDIGWEEGGLWWHGKFEYREVSLYGGKDDHIVGKYRGGPEGYAYTEIWDQQGFDYQPPRKNHEPAPQKPTPSRSRSKASASESTSTSSTSSSKRSSSGRGSIDSSAESSKRPSASNPASFASASKEVSSGREEEAAEDKVTGSGSASSNLGARVSASASTHTSASPPASLPSSLSSSRRNSEASSAFSSTSSSRRTSDSSYGEIDTAATSPCDSPLPRSAYSSLLECEDAQMLDSPIEGAAPFDKLEQALLALKAEKARAAGVPEPEDAIADTVSTHDVTAKMRLQPGQSFTLSQDGPSASHRWPKGRGVAKLAERPLALPRRRPSVPMPLAEEENLGYSC